MVTMANIIPTKQHRHYLWKRQFGDLTRFLVIQSGETHVIIACGNFKMQKV